MSNTLAPNGFTPVRRFDSAAPNFLANRYDLHYQNSNSFGKGDPVKLLGSGFIDKGVTTDAYTLGVLVGVDYYDTVLQKRIWSNGWLAPSNVASGSGNAYVVDDPFMTYEVQCNVTTTKKVAQGDFGMNAKYVLATPDSVLAISKSYLDTDNIATTSTYPWRITGFSLRGDNDTTANNNWAYVQLNNSQLTVQTLGIS